MAEYEMILTEVQGAAGVIRLNRPQAMNALCDQLMDELGQALHAFDADPAIAAIVLTGNDKAFAAGADIREMQPRSWPGTYLNDFIAPWEAVLGVRKPVIAAVAGFALGGGCEVAMMCDILLAADNARFGQPEIKLGIVPGAGGSQRLTRAIGKSKAMEMVLTGRMMDAAEAERTGLVARVVPLAELLPEAVALAQKIGELSPPAVAMAKEAVNAAFELPLREGLRLERRLFLSLFGTEDQKEGMAAFNEKRKPSFRRG
ncbi:enoyl-CoA hydratase [Pseudoroseomonas wenyumeiae]|uniref:enoyl-CoA hydratase n=1 Tax=Teichococcus wenyumeiae TaxID=2478470 RepID=A0A3A9JAK4_9PROT|nr:enoyl-CoA hydratase [Pseudoroseomonas wenyumeiae]RKK04317.1 enoyl-CoA hydratase [Pseudoroseomonas wenyumeiae]RMI26583.1 enoyl-CoA hydratase [Pseudoroseomonas wenyumeiae]